jgi:hypothetical protein
VNPADFGGSEFKYFDGKMRCRTLAVGISSRQGWLIVELCDTNKEELTQRSTEGHRELLIRPFLTFIPVLILNF